MLLLLFMAILAVCIYLFVVLNMEKEEKKGTFKNAGKGMSK